MTSGELIARARAAWRPAAVVGFAAFGVLLLVGRVHLPGGESFGYNSFARNLVVFVLAGVLLRADGLRLVRSRIGPALIGFLAAAALSIAVNRGGWGDFRLLATALGIFYVARILASEERGERWLFHWLGLLTVGVLLREVLHNPAILTLRESYRVGLVTDHANTLGFALAMLTPIFLAGTVRSDRRWAAWAYAACSCIVVVITFSRSAWLALAFGVVALALATRNRRVAVGAVATGVVATAAVAAATGYLSLGRTEADLQRLRIIEASMTLFREHPLVGIGFGIRNLERLFPVRYLELYGESLFLFHSHNLYVDVLTGTGVIGAVAAAVLLVTLAGVAWLGVVRARGAERRLEAVAYVISVGMFLLVGFVDMPFYHGRLVFLLAVVWAMMERAARIEAAPRPSVSAA
jgi:O-antigen ligase